MTQSVLFQLLERSDCPEGEFWRRERFECNQVILREGARSGKVYLMLRGQTRILGAVKVGEDQSVRTGVRDLGPGEVFGELAMLDKGPHSASVMAISDCEVAVFESDQLLSFLDRHPDFGYAVLKDIALKLVERLRKTDRQVFSLLAWGLKAHGLEEDSAP